MKFEYRYPSYQELEAIWDANVGATPEDPRWLRWREEYLGFFHSGKAKTYCVFCDGIPVGEGTLLLDPSCSAIGGCTDLADGSSVANVNALRIQKAFEGQGHISALVRLMERDAAEAGYRFLTIGVDACESRNRAIYLHWGYRELIRQEIEDGELVLYYRKEL